MKKKCDVGLRKFKQREQESLRAKEVLEYRFDDDTSNQGCRIDIKRIFNTN